MSHLKHSVHGCTRLHGCSIYFQISFSCADLRRPGPSADPTPSIIRTVPANSTCYRDLCLFGNPTRSAGSLPSLYRRHGTFGRLDRVLQRCFLAEYSSLYTFRLYGAIEKVLSGLAAIICLSKSSQILSTCSGVLQFYDTTMDFTNNTVSDGIRFAYLASPRGLVDRVVLAGSPNNADAMNLLRLRLPGVQLFLIWAVRCNAGPYSDFALTRR